MTTGSLAVWAPAGEAGDVVTSAVASSAHAATSRRSVMVFPRVFGRPQPAAPPRRTEPDPRRGVKRRRRPPGLDRLATARRAAGEVDVHLVRPRRQRRRRTGGHEVEAAGGRPPTGPLVAGPPSFDHV